MAYLGEAITMPSSFGSGVTGMKMTSCKMITSNAQNCIVMACLQYTLGSIDLSTGTFTDGVAMPTKTVAGASITTASVIPVMAVTTTIVATNPVITATYTNQAGTGSRTAALTVVSSSKEGSVYNIAPHLDATSSIDTGIRDVTNLTKSAGTSGIIEVWGLLPLAITPLSQTPSLYQGYDPTTVPIYPYTIGASEKIRFISMGISASNSGLLAQVYGVADN
jgi:hypothetical protein